MDNAKLGCRKAHQQATAYYCSMSFMVVNLAISHSSSEQALGMGQEGSQTWMERNWSCKLSQICQNIR